MPATSRLSSRSRLRSSRSQRGALAQDLLQLLLHHFDVGLDALLLLLRHLLILLRAEDVVFFERRKGQPGRRAQQRQVAFLGLLLQRHQLSCWRSWNSLSSARRRA
jgi:hypothetical protein